MYKEMETRVKIKLIEENNPEWKDLYYDIGGKEFDEGMKLLNEKSKTRSLPSQG